MSGADHHWGIWVFSKLRQGLQYYFPENSRCNLTYYESENVSSLYHIFESENFGFPFFVEEYSLNLGGKLWKIKLEKIVGNFFDIKASKIVHERNGHLEIFSRPQVIENSRQYLLLRTDILLKTIVGYPCVVEGDSNFWICDHWKWTFSLWQYFLMVLPVVPISLFKIWIFLRGGHYVKLIGYG